MKQNVIIIPTFNERDNIGPLIDCVQEELAAIPHRTHILVVDDESPDGTAEIVMAKQQDFQNIHLISGVKAGLGAAYIRGMKHAMEALAADVVFEMDADFSHKPKDIARLMEALDGGADFVIGSRYVVGGAVPLEWGVLRRANSLFGNLVARYGAGLRQIRDCTAGFRAIRTDLLQRIGLDSLDARGYAFQIDLLSEAIRLDARVVEVPVEFVDRKEGESKLGLSDIIEFVKIALQIRLRRSATLIKFCVVGGTGVIVNLSVFSLLLAAGMGKFLASPLAIEASIISNFFINNHWTFRYRRTGTRTRTRGLQFNLVSIAALSISYTSFVGLCLSLPHVRPQLLQLASIIPGTAVNFLLNSHWTFKHRPEPE